ncbi:MAG: ABC transporter ATP-binding protein [Saccharofermentanales bacterium]|jgi:branched-chain amino acid transport system ATP-binding protein
MRAIVELQDVSKQFGGLKAVSGFTGIIEEGSIVGLIGPNGAGKTTLFNMIAATFPPTSGSIIYDGMDITRKKTHDMAKLGLARTFQVTKPFGDMSVTENIMVGAFRQTNDRKAALETANKIYDQIEMNCGRDQLAHNLTTVDRKKLEIARALATGPKLLLLDEVMAGCNPHEKNELVEVVREIRDGGVTIIIIEHDIKTIMTLCEKIIVLHRGEKLVEGTPQEVANDQRAINAYLGEEYRNA